MSTLHDRVALVTGGGRGIGRAIAIGLAKAGARVAVTARTAAELEEVVGTIRSDGGHALALTADLADRAAPARVVRTVEEQWRPVQVLVNLAGDAATMVTGQAWNVCGGVLMAC